MIKEKDYLPEGIGEAEFIEIVNQVSNNPVYKFQFGYHGYEDMRQQAFLLAITFLREGKFKPRGEKPMRQQLANFLRIWIYNRLSNYRRDNCCKYPNNGGANQTKFNLQYALPIGAMGLTNSEIFAVESELPEKLSSEEISNRLSKGLKTHNKRLYNRYINGEELDEDEFNRLERSVRKVLTGEDEEYL